MAELDFNHHQAKHTFTAFVSGGDVEDMQPWWSSLIAFSLQKS